MTDKLLQEIDKDQKYFDPDMTKLAMARLSEAHALEAELQVLETKLTKGELKELPKDILRAQGYVIDIQKRAILTLEHALKSRDSIQSQLEGLLVTMSNITTAWKQTTDVVAQEFEKQVVSFTTTISTQEKELIELRTQVDLLTKRIKLLSGG